MAELAHEHVLRTAVFPKRCGRERWFSGGKNTEQSREVKGSPWGFPFSSFSDALGPFDVMKWP